MRESLQLLSSMAVRELLAELTARYRAVTGRAVQVQSAGGVDVAKRVRGGEPVDVVVLAGNAIDGLIADARVLPASRVDLVKSGIAIAVRAGARKPALDTEDAVRSAVLAAGSLSYSTGPSGVYLESLLVGWGLFERIRERIVVPPPGVPVASLVARGEVELGFQQLSELINVAGVEVAGPLPPSLQSITIFAGGIAAACADTPAARGLLEFMASPALADVKLRFGMQAA